MPKSENQKLKLLYILKILTEKSDEKHLFTAQQIIEELQKENIAADRKTIYKDVEELKNFGYDIILEKGSSRHGYYLATREFELAELKVLVDAVQASRFITQKKSKELIGKITKLAGSNDANCLKRQLYVVNRIKADNESIYYNVDDIHIAIQDNCCISFLYLEYTVDKQMRFKKNGERYEVSPWALIWNDENYYLIAYDNDAKKIKHFRVDKMKDIIRTQEKRILGEEYKSFNTAIYANEMFGMFSGELHNVSLMFSNKYIGIVLDRFGKDITIHKVDEESFSILVKVSISNQFFGWLAGLGTNAKILSPENVKEEYIKYLDDISKMYL